MFIPEDPLQSAREQFERERFNEQVQAELARLRAQAGRTPTQRLLDMIPFTITRKSK